MSSYAASGRLSRSLVTTLINHKDKPKKSERTQQAIQRVGQAVSVAVGDAIAQLTEVGTAVAPPVDGRTTVFSDRTGMVKAARMLLSSVTKVLVLADRIVIKQIITSRNKVLVTLEQLERVSTFQEFVQIFSQFGNQMVEFAHLTGDRQNTCLRHPDCESARINKDAVFHRMRFALQQVIEIVTDTRPCGETKVLPLSIYTGIKDFKSNVEGLREGLYSLPHQALSGQLDAKHSLNAREATEEMELSILKTCQSVYELRRELHKVAVGRAADLLKLHAEHLPLRALKASGGEGNLEAVAEYARTLGEQKEQLVEIISAAQTLALHPSSKIAKENLDVFCEAWESQLCDMAVLLREINDVFEGRRGDKRAYLSLPRPGKHSANLKTEQSTIAKLGLELRLLTSDVDTEVEKWEDQEHDIIRQGQSMSSMAYSIYLFTRGEGLLKTTTDLFHQAELMDEEKVVVLSEMEKLMGLCQQLQMGVRTPVQGKTATFQKVDSSIQNTRAIITVMIYLLPVCNKLVRKYKSERSSLGSPQSWRDRQSSTAIKDDVLNGKNSNGFGVKSLEQHMANFTFLESK
ncbi:unnamed protein product [Coregonus sp. 'balchen']|nr:unnamed protein product [Coregonus sp. 'balchen']